MRLLCLPLVLVVACVGDEPNPAAPPIETPDAGDPAPDGGADAGKDASCSEGPRCNDDFTAVVTCGARETCSLGCDPASSRCRTIVPAGAAARAVTDASTGALRFEPASETYVIDSATGSIGRFDEGGAPIGAPLRAPGGGAQQGIGYEVLRQAEGAPDLAVFSAKALSIAEGASVRVVGPNAVAFVLVEDVDIAGALDLSANCDDNVDVAGPGGSSTKREGELPGSHDGQPGNLDRIAPGVPNREACGGSGGGGGRARGGGGAEAEIVGARAGVGNGGEATTSPVDGPLVGGGAGGGVNVGGAGGGALQVVSNGTITVRGSVIASACGGRPAGFFPISAGNCLGSGGGGGGGTLLFEAGMLHITETARVLANGGGGGGGRNANGAVTRGAAGSRVDATIAVGGTSAVDPAAGACGNGQDANIETVGPAACSGVNGGNAGVSGASGGGSNGVLVARTATGEVRLDTGSLLSSELTRSIAVSR